MGVGKEAQEADREVSRGADREVSREAADRGAHREVGQEATAWATRTSPIQFRASSRPVWRKGGLKRLFHEPCAAATKGGGCGCSC
jgi:hypothetical protein